MFDQWLIEFNKLWASVSNANSCWTPCGSLVAGKSATMYAAKYITKDQLHRNFNHSGEGHNHCNIMFLSKDAQYMSALVMVDEKTRYTHLHFNYHDEDGRKVWLKIKESNILYFYIIFFDTKSFTTNKAILCFDDLCTRIWTYHTHSIYNGMANKLSGVGGY